MTNDYKWKIIKHPPDSARYAKCSCGFEYACDISLRPIKTIDDIVVYNYCPNCGKRKTEYYLEK
jgi:hypothetical protein